ncbi:MAG: hypothetical protein Fur0043_05600 [Anaerolineales bacterium]
MAEQLHMNKIIPLSLFLLCILAACAPAAETTPMLPLDTPQAFPQTATPETSALPAEAPSAVPDTICSLPENWSLSFRRTGGFAGFDQSLSVNSQGELQIESRKPPVTSNRLLLPEELTQLTESLRLACPFTASPREGTCADCFLYQLQIQWGDEAYTMQATDVTMPKEWSDLVGKLSMLFQANAP